MWCTGAIMNILQKISSKINLMVIKGPVGLESFVIVDSSNGELTLMNSYCFTIMCCMNVQISLKIILGSLNDLWQVV